MNRRKNKNTCKISKWNTNGIRENKIIDKLELIRKWGIIRIIKYDNVWSKLNYKLMFVEFSKQEREREFKYFFES